MDSDLAGARSSGSKFAQKSLLLYDIQLGSTKSRKGLECDAQPDHIVQSQHHCDAPVPRAVW